MLLRWQKSIDNGGVSERRKDWGTDWRGRERQDEHFLPKNHLILQSWNLKTNAVSASVCCYGGKVFNSDHANHAFHVRQLASRESIGRAIDARDTIGLGTLASYAHHRSCTLQMPSAIPQNFASRIGGMHCRFICSLCCILCVADHVAEARNSHVRDANGPGRLQFLPGPLIHLLTWIICPL